MAKILKNTTANAIELSAVGLEIDPNSQITIEVDDYIIFATTDAINEITPLINSGDIVVNDGVNDLSASDAINFLSYPDEAFNVRFRSEPERSNSLSSKDVQTAIEEVYNTTVLNDRSIVMLGRDGELKKNKYLEFMRGIPSNKTKFVTPIPYKIKELSLSNKSNNTGTVSILINGTEVTTISLTNAKSTTVTGLNIDLLAGDELSAKGKSGELKDAILNIFMKHV